MQVLKEITESLNCYKSPFEKGARAYNKETIEIIVQIIENNY